MMCGRCGQRMTVRYHRRRDGLVPEYVCQRDGIERAEGRCQTIPGRGIDQHVGELLLEMVTPVTLEVALTVQQELQSRLDEVERLRLQQVERARYEADLARHRYLQVDPNHRLVADSLEADWNDKLRALQEVQEQCQRQSQADRAMLDEKTRAEIATHLNNRGLRTGKGRKFTLRLVGNVRRGYRLKSRYQRLRETGLLTAAEMAAELGVCKTTVHDWRRLGLLPGHA